MSRNEKELNMPEKKLIRLKSIAQEIFPKNIDEWRRVNSNKTDQEIYWSMTVESLELYAWMYEARKEIPEVEEVLQLYYKNLSKRYSITKDF